MATHYICPFKESVWPQSYRIYVSNSKSRISFSIRDTMLIKPLLIKENKEVILSLCGHWLWRSNEMLKSLPRSNIGVMDINEYTYLFAFPNRFLFQEILYGHRYIKICGHKATRLSKQTSVSTQRRYFMTHNSKVPLWRQFSIAFSL